MKSLNPYGVTQNSNFAKVIFWLHEGSNLIHPNYGQSNEDYFSIEYESSAKSDLKLLCKKT